MQPASPPLPSFSVLVANHNHARLVGLAIASVLGQDYPADLREVVVVDDGSTDDSRERLQAYVDTPGVRVVLQDNRGQTAAYAAALAQARGDYVCLLDADDSCLPQKLRRLAEHLATLQTSPATLFLCHDTTIVDGVDGPALPTTWFEVMGLRRFGPLLHVSQVDHSFPFAVTSGMVFGRGLLQRVMDALPQWEWRMGMDTIAGHTAMLMAGEVHFVHEPLARYVVHGGNDGAGIADGVYRPKPVWQARWPKALRFLELLVDSLPLSERERADRLACLGRVEHHARSVPAGRPHTRPLLSFIVDAATPQGAADVAADAAAHVAPPIATYLAAHLTANAVANVVATASAIAEQSESHCQTVWLCRAGTRLPAGVAGERVEVSAADGVFARWRAGLAAARGAYLCFLDAGDLPERRFVERHLQTHRFGNLPMLTVSDLRLLDADGVVLHAGIQATAQPGWGSSAPHVPAFGTLLRDWALAPLPAVVFRRTPLIDAYFEGPAPAVHERHVGWLLCQYVLQMGGATRLAENLMDLRLPRGATPNASWLSSFVDRHGPLPTLELAASAEALFAVYMQASPHARSFFSEGWEQRFLRWLLQSGGAEMPARIERRLQRSGDAAWAARVRAALRAATAP